MRLVGLISVLVIRSGDILYVAAQEKICSGGIACVATQEEIHSSGIARVVGQVRDFAVATLLASITYNTAQAMETTSLSWTSCAL